MPPLKMCDVSTPLEKGGASRDGRREDIPHIDEQEKYDVKDASRSRSFQLPSAGYRQRNPIVPHVLGIAHKTFDFHLLDEVTLKSL